MDWQTVVIIVLGVISFFTLCCAWAIVEGEWRKRKEQRKWDEWAKRGGPV